MITTSTPRNKISASSSTTKANTQESENSFPQTANDKDKINNNAETETKMKPKDFLLKMMLLSQDTNSVLTPEFFPQKPLNEAMVETKDNKGEMETENKENKEAWQAVSSLTTIFERGKEESQVVTEDAVSEEDGFGDNLQLIFLQADTQHDLPHAQELVHHVQHGDGGAERLEPEQRMQEPDRLSLDFDHQHHLERVHPDFKPAVATSEYGSQWLPVFSPSHRVD